VPDDDLVPVDLPRPAAGAHLWLDRWDEVRSRWEPWQLVLGAAVAVGALVAALMVLRPTAAAPVEASLPMVATTTTAAGPTATSDPRAELVVYLVGAVAKPGVYTVKPGSRVDDLVAVAGGLTPDADPARINLAAPVRDGERVAVPRIGEAMPPPDGTSSGDPSAPTEPLDLNAATAAELETLPGIGPATAKAIVDERERNGPFSSVDDLLRVRGIGPAKLDQIRQLVSV
jgi:competence protein ComEA